MRNMMYTIIRKEKTIYTFERIHPNQTSQYPLKHVLVLYRSYELCEIIIMYCTCITDYRKYDNDISLPKIVHMQ